MEPTETYEHVGRLPRVLTAGNLFRMVLIGAVCLLFILATSCRSQRPIIPVKVSIDTTVYSDSGQIDFNINCDDLKRKYDSVVNRPPNIVRAPADTVFIPDTVYVPAKDGKPEGRKITQRPAVLIYSDSLADVFYSIKSNGDFAFKVKIKPQAVPLKFEKEAKIPCPECPEPGFFYVLKKFSWVWCLCLILGSFTMGWFLRNRK